MADESELKILTDFFFLQRNQTSRQISSDDFFANVKIIQHTKILCKKIQSPHLGNQGEANRSLSRSLQHAANQVTLH